MPSIPSCPAALPKKARLGLSTIGSDSPINSWLSFNSFAPGTSQEILELGEDVNTGTLSALESQARLNRRVVAPQYSGTPTAAEWRNLLPWLFDGREGGSGTSGSPYTYPLADALSRRYMAWDDTQVYWDLYAVGVNTATISASASDPAVRCSLGLVGVDWDNSGTFPGGLNPPTDAPFIFTDSSGAVSIGGTPRKVASVSISIDKMVADDRYFNSTTITCAVSQRRKVTLTITYPHGLHSDLWTLGDSTSVAASVAFTFGAKVLTFTMPKVRHAPEAPGADVPNEIMGTWTGVCMASASLNDEISATLALS